MLQILKDYFPNWWIFTVAFILTHRSTFTTSVQTALNVLAIKY